MRVQPSHKTSAEGLRSPETNLLHLSLESSRVHSRKVPDTGKCLIYMSGIQSLDFFLHLSIDSAEFVASLKLIRSKTNYIESAFLSRQRRLRHPRFRRCRGKLRHFCTKSRCVCLWLNGGDLFPHRFTVRDFQYNEEEMKADKEEMTRLSTDKKKQFVSGGSKGEVSQSPSDLKRCSHVFFASCIMLLSHPLELHSDLVRNVALDP